MVDTCGGEFEAETPYFYSTYEPGGETQKLSGRKVLIVGSGPIRIGQGVEFDYCCVQGILALREEEVSAIIANNNPETVSTDFDISTRLYFEPLLLEDVLNIIEEEKPDGVIVQFGGQTSINLAVPLARELSRRRSRTKILGTPPAAIDLAEDRRKFAALMQHLRIRQPEAASGYAACVLPAQTLSTKVLDEIRTITRQICEALDIVGCLNLQLAVKDDMVYVLEANPRASRTIPYVSKAIGVSLAKVATKVMLGRSLRNMDLVGEARPDHVAVKAPVFPFQRLPGVDTILGPEMKSTGEVMGIDRSLGRAYYKAMLAAGNPLPTQGAVYVTVRDEDKPTILPVAERLARIGLRIFATRGTAQFLREHGVDATTVYRISENESPDALGLMRRGEIRLVINTPTNSTGARRDGYMMRRLAVDLNITFIATLHAGQAP